MEAVAVRRPRDARAGGGALLHADQDGDGALADGDSRWSGYDDADVRLVEHESLHCGAVGLLDIFDGAGSLDQSPREELLRLSGGGPQAWAGQDLCHVSRGEHRCRFYGWGYRAGL